LSDSVLDRKWLVLSGALFLLACVAQDN